MAEHPKVLIVIPRFPWTRQAFSAVRRGQACLVNWQRDTSDIYDGSTLVATTATPWHPVVMHTHPPQEQP